MAFGVKVETVAENATEDGDADSGNKNANGEDENMESLLSSFGEEGEDADFMASEEKEAAAALERRRKRKRRLQVLEASADTTTKTDANTNANPTKIKKKTEAIQQIPEINSANVLKAESSAMDEDKKGAQTDGNDSSDDDDSDSDDSDMFGSPSSEEKTRKKKKKKINNSGGQAESKTKDNREASRQDGFDDNDGYYKASIGETMELEVLGANSRIQNDNENEAWTLKLRVLGIIGKGVFSSVLKCSTTATATTDLSRDDGIPSTISLLGGNGLNVNNEHHQHGLPTEVAIKCIRSNETMAKAALDEMKFLIRLRDSPGIVPLLLPAPQNSDKTNQNYIPPPIDFRGHTLLVFPYLPYNLRDVLQKFGKGVGLSLGAVKNYYRQLLSAAIHLQKKGVIHADIKPDNILVSADFSRVVVADFGSAFESRIVYNEEDEGTSAVTVSSAQSNQNEAVTPYLVSRFYRAPEIILGLQPLTYAIDLWSLAVTAGELFLGKVLLRGTNNNDMLYAMMELLVSKLTHKILCHEIKSQLIDFPQ